MERTRTLDLGSGRNPKNPFFMDEVIGVDIADVGLPNVVCADLAVGPIPFQNDCFEALTAFDFIEHIPRVIYTPVQRFPFVELMNEIYRVLKPNGKFLSFTPAFPSPSAFVDPTHVNIITEDTFSNYFSGDYPKANLYGFKGKFKLVMNQWHDWASWPIAAVSTVPNPGKTHLLTVLEKIQ
jgi:SAM-dependent methyltransferase